MTISLKRSWLLLLLSLPLLASCIRDGARRLSAAPCGDSREGQELLQRGQGGYGGA